MEHKRTPGRRAFTIPGSVIVATLAVCLVAAGILITAVVSTQISYRDSQGTTSATDSADAEANSVDGQADSDSQGAQTGESSQPKDSGKGREGRAGNANDTDGGPNADKADDGDDSTKGDTKKDQDKPVKRVMPVSVYNNTSASGRASQVADQARSKGWEVVSVSNWRGQIPDTTVYYPDGKRADAKALAKDMKITRIKPAVEPMQADRLTIIISGVVPQSDSQHNMVIQ